MDLSERRVVGSIILLSGLTFIAIGLNSQQLNIVLEIVKKIFQTSIAPLPV